MENLSRQRAVNLLLSNDPKPIQQLLARFLWALVSYVPFAFPGRQLSILRVTLLRLFGAKIGKKVLVSSGVHVWFPWRLSIGDCSALGRSVEIYNYQDVRIGSNTVISQYSYICTAGHNYASKSMDFYAKPIGIGNYAWIAADVMICPGVLISDGSVVGARSLVTTDLGEWAVYAGVPARKIKDRVLT
jgi:putative colanic acid biosynthesis acetyltransferase WcaF